MNNTDIEWTDKTWNPVTGCHHDCPYCYGKRMVKRFTSERDYRLCKLYNDSTKTKYGRIWELDSRLFRDDYKGTKIPHPFWFEPTFHKYRLDEPLNRKKPAKIFVCSMGELFGNWIPAEWIEKVLDVVKQCSRHTFQFLTKNPYRYKEFDFPENCWLGTTIEGNDEENTYHRYWGLYEKQKNIQFISFEPLLGAKEFENMLEYINWLDWIIIGSQTGPRAKQPKKEWVQAILDACNYHDIPVFLKDNLDWSKKIQEWPE